MTDRHRENQPMGYEPPKSGARKPTTAVLSPASTVRSPGPRFERELPIGKHPRQLYSQGTPNGQKVTILLEELPAAGPQNAEYDA